MVMCTLRTEIICHLTEYSKHSVALFFLTRDGVGGTGEPIMEHIYKLKGVFFLILNDEILNCLTLVWRGDYKDEED